MKILSQRSVETAKPKAKRYGKPDGLIPGMQLIVQPSGTKSYTLFARVGGKLINTRLGPAGVLTLAQARDAARGKLGMIAAGKDPRAAKREAQSAEPFATVAQRFVERHAKVHNRKWRETERQLARDVLPRWRHRPIDSITKQDVVALLDHITDRGAPIQANRTLAVVRRIFGWCIERGTLETSPCDRIRKPAPETERNRVLGDREIALAWAAADTLGYPSGPLIQMLILSGQRRCEVSDMRWSELDPALTLWTLPRERSKNDVEHLIPVAPAMRDILRGLPRIEGEAGYVFTTNGKVPVSGFTRVKRNLDAAVTALNGGKPIAPWILHDFRRSVSTTLNERLEVAPHIVETILGHVGGHKRGVAGVYNKALYLDQCRAALDLWSAHVLALAQGEPDLRRKSAGR